MQHVEIIKKMCRAYPKCGDNTNDVEIQNRHVEIILKVWRCEHTCIDNSKDVESARNMWR